MICFAAPTTIRLVIGRERLQGPLPLCIVPRWWGWDCPYRDKLILYRKIVEVSVENCVWKPQGGNQKTPLPYIHLLIFNATLSVVNVTCKANG